MTSNLSACLLTLLNESGEPPQRFAAAEIERRHEWMLTRDGVRLSTRLYLPPVAKAPAVAMRTPYDKDSEGVTKTCVAFARAGYVALAQDCRGTGASEPDHWDYYVREGEDGYDFVEWVTRQSWFDGFLGGGGSSYVAQTQWHMAVHPRMGAIAPEVSGLGIATNTARLYMFLNAYARSMGKGEGKLDIGFDELERRMVPETLAGGFFNEPLDNRIPLALRRAFGVADKIDSARAGEILWRAYCEMSCAERADFIKQATGSAAITIVDMESLPALFGQHIAHDAHTLPHDPPAGALSKIQAPALMITGWYDWGLNDALATWSELQKRASPIVREQSRLIITPSAHNMPGFHEGAASELQRTFRTSTITHLLAHWYDAVRAGSLQDWPAVCYYLMGANEWRVAGQWPPAESREVCLYLAPERQLVEAPPVGVGSDSYIYDPDDPAPTVGGSIVSYVIRPGSVDVSKVQERADVVSYTSAPLAADIDIVGPVRAVLFASSSARDTDFVVRLSYVEPDGRAIQLQNGVLRARYRKGRPAPLEPGVVERFDIDLWATAYRFTAGQRISIDISSSDFPRFDRNTNRCGEPGPPVIAEQRIFHGGDHASHVVLSMFLRSTVVPGRVCPQLNSRSGLPLR